MISTNESKAPSGMVKRIELVKERAMASHARWYECNIVDSSAEPQNYPPSRIFLLLSCVWEKGRKVNRQNAIEFNFKNGEKVSRWSDNYNRLSRAVIRGRNASAAALRIWGAVKDLLGGVDAVRSRWYLGIDRNSGTRCIYPNGPDTFVPLEEFLGPGYRDRREADGGSGSSGIGASARWNSGWSTAPSQAPH